MSIQNYSKGNRTYRNPDWFRKMYQQMKLPLWAMAKICGCSEETIRRYKKIHGVEQTDKNKEPKQPKRPRQRNEPKTHGAKFSPRNNLEEVLEYRRKRYIEELKRQNGEQKWNSF